MSFCASRIVIVYMFIKTTANAREIVLEIQTFHPPIQQGKGVIKFGAHENHAFNNMFWHVVLCVSLCSGAQFL